MDDNPIPKSRYATPKRDKSNINQILVIPKCIRRLSRAELKEIKNTEKDGVWVLGFMRNIINVSDDANAVRFFGRGRFGINRKLTSDEVAKLTAAISRTFGDSFVLSQAPNGSLLAFERHDDAPNTFQGVIDVAKSILPDVKCRWGVMNIDEQRCFITKKPWWDNPNDRPRGFYAYDDLFK